MVIFTGEHLG